MSFGALAVWQAGLLLAGAGALAAWLFLMKLRPPQVLVPSLLLWRRVLDEARELTLWERIRRAVSLAATILIALMLALAVARPSRAVGAAAASRGRLLIVIDSSWSMLTRTGHGETRWDRAIAEARRLAAAASGDEVALATTADGLVEGPTPDLALIETALDRIAPAGGETAAFPRMAGSQIVHFITDGTLARPLDPGIEIDSVYEPAANVAITAFSVRPSLDHGRAGDAYLEIANFAAAAQKVHLTIERGTATVFDRALDIGRGEALHQVVPLPSGGDALLRARVDAPENSLKIDDEATAWIDKAQPLRLTVVGQDTAWLAALLGQDPGTRATFVSPPAYRPGGEDVVILDRWTPAERPSRPALCVAPPVATPWLSARSPAGDDPSTVGAAGEERRPRWVSSAPHPILEGVDPLTLTIEKAHGYRAPLLTPVAMSARGTPLVSVEASATGRLVVLGFGPGESNLASAPAFPVLIGNALEWLARPEAGGPRRPGPVRFDEGVVRVSGPRGVAVPLERVNHAAIGVLRAPGVYVAEGGGARSTIAVNVGDAQVSNVGRTNLAAAGARAVTAGASSHAWWMYCVLAAFALIVAEWWTWQRRITV